MFQRTLLRLQVPKRSILSRQCLSSASSSGSSSAEDKFLYNQHESKKFVSLTNLNKIISDVEESEKFSRLWKHNIFPDSNLMSTRNIDLYFGMFVHCTYCTLLQCTHSQLSYIIELQHPLLVKYKFDIRDFLEVSEDTYMNINAALHSQAFRLYCTK